MQKTYFHISLNTVPCKKDAIVYNTVHKKTRLVLKNRAPNAPADHGCMPDASACETASVAGRCRGLPALRARWAARGSPGCCTSPCCHQGSAGRQPGLLTKRAKFKVTVRQDWICMRVVPLDRP
jgi:hypothetical protein